MSPSNKTLCKPQLEQSHPDQALHQTRQSNDSNNTSTTASLHRTHTSQQHLNISFSTPDSHYPTTYNMSTPPGYRMSRSIKDDQPIDLMGPVDVLGYVKSGSGVNLTGEVIVREKLEAYGAIFINGSVSCGLVGICEPFLERTSTDVLLKQRTNQGLREHNRPRLPLCQVNTLSMDTSTKEM